MDVGDVRGAEACISRFRRARWRVGPFPEGQVPISRGSAGR